MTDDPYRIELVQLPPDAPAGAVYDRCRDLERGLTVVRDDDQRAVSAAADELTRSCRTEPFVVRGVVPRSGPLCFIDNRPDALATRCCAVPGELRVKGIDLVADFIAELPVPVIALQATAMADGWWVVLAAHETGHHVYGNADLRVPTRAALMNISNTYSCHGTRRCSRTPPRC
jgi:hypothetical protein